MNTSDVLATGLVLGESPRWHDGAFWVSDWVAGHILRFGGDGARHVVHEGLGMPFSFDWDRSGRMLVIAGARKALLREGPGGRLEPFVDLSDICDKPWNEIVVDGRGNAYLNSIGFDMMAGEEREPGVIALVTPDGSARKVAEGLGFPNGMAVTPDNSTLIIAESYGERLTAFDIAHDGSLSLCRTWADLPGSAPDGICIDHDSAVWYADVPNRCCVRVCEHGEVLETVSVDRGCFACMLGGEDGQTLYIVAADWNGPGAVAAGGPSGQILTTRVSAGHAGWP